MAMHHAIDDDTMCLLESGRDLVRQQRSIGQRVPFDEDQLVRDASCRQRIQIVLGGGEQSAFEIAAVIVVAADDDDRNHAPTRRRYAS